MSLLQEIIVYVWLVPVVAQIVLPLSVLLIWSIKKVLTIIIKKSTALRSIYGNEIEISGSST